MKRHQNIHEWIRKKKLAALQVYFLGNFICVTNCLTLFVPDWSKLTERQKERLVVICDAIIYFLSTFDLGEVEREYWLSWHQLFSTCLYKPIHHRLFALMFWFDIHYLFQSPWWSELDVVCQNVVLVLWCHGENCVPWPNKTRTASTEPEASNNTRENNIGRTVYQKEYAKNAVRFVQE